MSDRPFDENTKPSRIKRRRKRRWKIADLLIKHNKAQQNSIKLTFSPLAATMPTAGSSQRGRGNPFNKGDKTPLPLVAFLCLSFSAAFGRVYSVMAGCLGSLRAGRSFVRYFHPTQPVAHAVESIGGGYPLYKGFTA